MKKTKDLTIVTFPNVKAIEWKKANNGIATIWLLECQKCPEKRRWWTYAEVIMRKPDLCCRECRKAIQAEKRTTHGLRGTLIYKVHAGIIQRCENPHHKAYGTYGGDGVRICKGWRDSVESFAADNGHVPPGGYTIDRKNNEGNYTCGHCADCIERGDPMNCRWLTREGQANNRSTNIFLTAFGKTQTISQWSRELGIDKTTILKRYNKGWSHEKCLSKVDFRKNQT